MPKSARFQPGEGTIIGTKPFHGNINPTHTFFVDALFATATARKKLIDLYSRFAVAMRATRCETLRAGMELDLAQLSTG